MNKTVFWAIIITGFCFMAGCSSPPLGLKPVQNFKLSRYLGTWHEIARLDHTFERDLADVTASYYLRSDGSVSVLNKGCNTKTSRWQTARGAARFKGDPELGALKVCFFWPFWADYYILNLDHENYNWAVVTSSSPKYLWILSRTPTMDESTLQALIGQAKRWGFETDKLIFPSGGKNQ